jgi:3-mercaptopyruvate sulfurtransferase SseA
LKSTNAAKGSADMIAGAVQYDYNALFDSDGTFREHNQIEAAYKKLGITGETQTIIHVTDDSRSSYGYFTLRLLGYPSVKMHCSL